VIKLEDLDVDEKAYYRIKNLKGLKMKLDANDKFSSHFKNWLKIIFRNLRWMMIIIINNYE
jgi:hypothetical protein